MGRKSSTQLWQRYNKILLLIAQNQESHGCPPTYREIGQEIGVNSTSQVTFYLKQLIKLGYLQQEKHASRGLRLVKLPDELKDKCRRVLPEIRTIPILGRIVAGKPIPLPESDVPLYDPESAIDIPLTLLSTTSRDLFALEVEGESMIDAMINDGDIVILHPTQQARNGDLVAAWLNEDGIGETTLKRYYLENEQVRLQPANPDYPPILARPDKVTIQGKVILVIRQMK